ncbi:type VII secretion integral membrane protein EccD [Dermatophilaceae bacterium Soc4.6]
MALVTRSPAAPHTVSARRPSSLLDTSHPSGADSAVGREPHHDLVRITVTARGGRRDLVLPARIPVVELVPQIVTLLAVAGADAWGGWTLVGLDGRQLDPGVSLLSQAVDDGAVLALVPTPELRAVTGGPGAVGWRDDDVAQTVADVVDDLGARWGPGLTAVATRVAAGVAILLVLAGLVARTVDDPSGPTAALAATAAACLVVVAMLLGRTRRAYATTVAVLLAAGPYAALSVLALRSDDRLGWPLVGAGAAVVVLGRVGPLALRQRHWLFHAPVVVGVVAATLGATHALTGVDAAAIAAVLVVSTSVGARFAPWWGLAAAGSVLAGAPAPELAVVRADVARSVTRARHLVLGVTVGVCVVIVVSSPLLVGLGPAGLGIVCACGTTAALRARRLALRLEILVGLAGGAAIVVSGIVSSLLLHPEWAAGLTGAAGAAAVLALASVVVPPRPGPRWEQVLDLVEGLALGALLPLLVVTVGLMAAVRGAGR